LVVYVPLFVAFHYPCPIQVIEALCARARNEENCPDVIYEWRG